MPRHLVPSPAICKPEFPDLETLNSNTPKGMEQYLNCIYTYLYIYTPIYNDVCIYIYGVLSDIVIHPERNLARQICLEGLDKATLGVDGVGAAVGRPRLGSRV